MNPFKNLHHKFPTITLALVILLSLACGSTTRINPSLTSSVIEKKIEHPTQADPTGTSTSIPSLTITLTPKPSVTPKPLPTPLPIGSKLTVADWEYSISSVKVLDTIGNKKARGIFVVALLDVTNIASQERELGSDIFMATDAQGRIYEFSSDASLEYHQTYNTPAWFLDEVPASGQTTIPLVFDISPDATQIGLMALRSDNPALLIAEAAGGQPLRLEGQVFNYADWDYVLIETKTANTIGDYSARGKYVIAVVEIQNRSLTPRELGSNFFQARDSEDRIYTMSSDASLAYYQAYKMNTWFLDVLNPSLVGEIPIVFDVALDANQVTLIDRADNMNPLIDTMGGQALTLDGDIQTVGNWEFVIKEVKTATTIGNNSPNGIYVIIILNVKNTDLVSQEFEGYFLSLKDSAEHIYEFDSEASLEYHHNFKTDAWHLESIGPSLTGTIPIVFDVSSGVTGLILKGTDVDIAVIETVP